MTPDFPFSTFQSVPRSIKMFLISLLLFAHVISNPATSTSPVTLKIEPQAPTSIELDNYLVKLATCESGGSWTALNPKDLDGTASKGKFQFKDGTFDYFSARYGVATTSIWNGDEQEEIVRFMTQDPKVNMHLQFPDCVRKLGLPPKIE